MLTRRFEASPTDLGAPRKEPHACRLGVSPPVIAEVVGATVVSGDEQHRPRAPARLLLERARDRTDRKSDVQGRREGGDGPAEESIRDYKVTGVQTCALPIYAHPSVRGVAHRPRCPTQGATRVPTRGEPARDC